MKKLKRECRKSQLKNRLIHMESNINNEFVKYGTVDM